MLQLLLVLVAVAGGYWLIKLYYTASAQQIGSFLTALGGLALIVFAAFLALRGGIEAAIPLFGLGLGLLGKQTIFPGGFQSRTKTPGQKSRVTTQLLSMELDHDTGEMIGHVLSGTFQGRALSSLADDELQLLHRLSTGVSDQSRALLESWLDHARPNWRDRWSMGSESSSSTSSAMTREEAWAILGLKPGASDNEIRQAHRRLMKNFHPDHGGTDYIAAKINQAKDLLLQR